jgi:hypothetical protein
MLLRLLRDEKSPTWSSNLNGEKEPSITFLNQYVEYIDTNAKPIVPKPLAIEGIFKFKCEVCDWGFITESGLTHHRENQCKIYYKKGEFKVVSESNEEGAKIKISLERTDGSSIINSKTTSDLIIERYNLCDENSVAKKDMNRGNKHEKRIRSSSKKLVTFIEIKQHYTKSFILSDLNKQQLQFLKVTSKVLCVKYAQ